MGSYEQAPATGILATACACCGRPLCDATSVEAGVGPECRARHGFDEAQGEPDWRSAALALEAVTDSRPAGWAEDARQAANGLVHAIAVEQRGLGVAARCNALRALGYQRLAERIVERLAKVRIAVEGDELAVVTPYDERALAAWRQVPGRRWDPAAKCNRVPRASRPAVWALLLRCYAGQHGVGPQGLFVIGEGGRQ